MEGVLGRAARGRPDTLSGIRTWNGSLTIPELRKWTKSLVPVTFDYVMDAVDSLARGVGMSQTPRYGWIPELQELLVLFTHSERQVQDF